MEAKVENERLLLFPRLSVNNWLLKIDILQNAAKKCYYDKCLPHVLHDYSLFSADSIDIDSLAFAKA